MPGRKYSAETGYRYGFNGKENDNEVKGEGNQQDYGMRIYDPRLGRFLSVDPLTKFYPMLTAFQFASNSPIQAVDVDGAEGERRIGGDVRDLYATFRQQGVSHQDAWSAAQARAAGGAVGSVIGLTLTSAPVLYPYLVTSATGGAIWLSNPSNQHFISQIAGFSLEIINPDPNGAPVNFPGEGDEIARGVKVLFAKTTTPLLKGFEKFSVNTNKFDYFFGKLEYQNLKGADLEEYASKVSRTVESLRHNQDRAASMSKIFDYWGIKDNKVGLEKMAELFEAGLQGTFVSSRTTEHGTSVTRQISLVFSSGPRKGESAGSLQISFFYKNGDMNATPEVSSVIPIPDKKIE